MLFVFVNMSVILYVYAFLGQRSKAVSCKGTLLFVFVDSFVFIAVPVVKLLTFFPLPFLLVGTWIMLKHATDLSKPLLLLQRNSVVWIITRSPLYFCFCCIKPDDVLSIPQVILSKFHIRHIPRRHCKSFAFILCFIYTQRKLSAFKGL